MVIQTVIFKFVGSINSVFREVKKLIMMFSF